MKTIEDEADYYIQDADARMRSCKPEDLPTFTEQLKGAFIAGVDKERERLTARYEAEVAKYKRDLDESREREKIACKAVAEKREEIARLTKWNDPKDKMPTEGVCVLCKADAYGDIQSLVLSWEKGLWWTFSAGVCDDEGWHILSGTVIGWREIHE